MCKLFILNYAVACPSSQASRPLQALALEPGLLQALALHKVVTARDLLNLNAIDLMEMLDLSHQHARDLIRHVSQQLAPPYVSALHLWRGKQEAQSYLPTGIPVRTMLFSCRLLSSFCAECVSDPTWGCRQA